jgi:hypothetical protein
LTSSRYREHAEQRTAADLDLYPLEIRSFVLAQCPPEDRKKLKDRVDWSQVDLVARRCVKKTMKKYDLSQREAQEVIRDAYLEAFHFAEVEEEDQ